MLLGVWTIASSTAHADSSEDLVVKGQDLAKRGDWSQAINAFKQADAQHPRAENACFIGLAYLRRELWAQSELFFAKCHARANASDPLPTWLGEAEGQLAQKLRDQNVAKITIDVTPAAAQPEISITGFLPDELAGRGTIHLVPGRYTLSVRAPGYLDAQREVEVKNRDAQLVRVQLVAPGSVKLREPVVPSPSKLPWIVVGGGLALGITGVVIDVTKLHSLRDELSTSTQSYDRNSSSFDSWRELTVGLWIGGAIVTGLGTYLALRTHSSITIDAKLERDGGALLVGWQR